MKTLHIIPNKNDIVDEKFASNDENVGKVKMLNKNTAKMSQNMEVILNILA